MNKSSVCTQQESKLQIGLSCKTEIYFDVFLISLLLELLELFVLVGFLGRRIYQQMKIFGKMKALYLVRNVSDVIIKKCIDDISFLCDLKNSFIGLVTVMLSPLRNVIYSTDITACHHDDVSSLNFSGRAFSIFLHIRNCSILLGSQ